MEEGRTSRSDRFRNCVTVVQSTVAFGAALWAACWWFLGRDMTPRANLSLDVNHVQLDSGKHLLRIVMNVENVGKVRLRTHDVDIYVYQIKPLPESGTPPKPYELKRTPYGDAYQWPVIIGNDHVKLNYIFDPGECSPIVYEEIIDKLPEVALVYVNVLYDSNPDDGWDAYKMVEFDKDGTVISTQTD